MKKIRFYVMEDVPYTLAEILDVLNETEDCEVLGSSDNIQSGYEDIVTLKPDALLLDIMLLGGTAFELINKLKQNQFPIPPVVIMTGEANFQNASEAVDSVGPALVKLLDKPFWNNWVKEFPEIKSAILTRMAQLNQEDPDLLFRVQNAQDELLVRSSHMTYRVVLDRVLYINSESGYSTFMMQGGKSIKIRKTLNDLMAKLPANFCRIGRNIAVNLKHLEQIDHETNELFLEGCKENFFIGEPFKPNLKTALGI